MMIESEKINKYFNAFLQGVFVLIFLINLHFMYLFHYAGIIKYVFNRNLANGLIAFAVAVMCYFFYGRENRKENPFISGFSLYTVFVFLIILVYTFIQYPDQSLRTTIISTVSVLGILWAYVGITAWKTIEDFHRLMLIFEYILLVWFLVVALQFIVYELSGRIILDFSSYFEGLQTLWTNGVITRNDRLRINLGGGLVCMVMVYNFDIVYNTRRKNPIYVIVLLLGLLEMVFVQQTRFYILGFALGALISMLLPADTKKKKIKNLVILAVLLILAIKFDIITDFVKSFLLNGSKAGSTRVRLYAIEYYWDYFRHHIFLGMGGVSDSVTSGYAAFVHGKRGRFFLEDIGYLGTLTNGGLLLGSILVILLFRCSYIIAKMTKDERKEYAYLPAIFVTAVTIGIPFNQFLTQRIDLILPVMLAMFELFYKDKRNRTASPVHYNKR